MAARPGSAGAALAIATVLLVAGCSGDGPTSGSPPAPNAGGVTTSQPVGGPGGSAPRAVVAPSTVRTGPAADAPWTPSVPTAASEVHGLLPGMPAPLSAADVYAADRPGQLSAAVAGIPYRIYVPATKADVVDVIDPGTFRVVDRYRVGREPQHVVPSWDLRTLWVNNDLGNTLTPIDPRTTRPGRPVDVRDPYNLYFTPDGRRAVVMASADRQLVFRDPQTMRALKVVPAGCDGVNHADWTADGRYFLVSCEFSGQLLWVDTVAERVVRIVPLPRGGKPQDVKLAPDGSRFFVADMERDGVWIVRVTDTGPLVVSLLHTGKGAHGIYVGRDSRHLYVSNRDEGTVSTVRLSDDTVDATWRIPGGGSPDMGGVSPDGKVLWLSGRYDDEVYAIDTTTGRLLRRIPVDAGPHGLCVFPQPGRYSLGHTGVFR